MANTETQDIVGRALPGIERALDLARKAEGELSEYRQPDGARSESETGDPDGELEHAAETNLKGQLQRLSLGLLLTLEAADLQQSRNKFAADWAAQGDLGRTEYFSPSDVVYSPPLEFLNNFVESLRVLATRGESPVQNYKLQALEDILRATAHLVRKRNVTPRNEADVQRVMHDYLEVAFSDFTKKPQIPGILKNFQPDGGVRSVRAAIEFKFADSSTKVRTGVSGILEDSAGYRGSLDWTRFFSVIYQTESFETEARLREDLFRCEAFSWTPILVTAPPS